MLRHHARHGLATAAAVFAISATLAAEDESSPATATPATQALAPQAPAPQVPAPQVPAPQAPADADAVIETVPEDAGPLAAAAACLDGLDAFEVLVSTIVRDAGGNRLAPPSRGRVAFERHGDITRFVVDTWGGLGSARLACDGETVTLGDPTTRAFESWPLPEDPARLLDDPELTARFGPAAVHLLGLMLDDGLDAFRQVGERREVDLGPRRATLIPCQSMLDETGGDVRMAFAASGPPLPLAVAVLLPDGGVVELEFHDWRCGPVADAPMQFVAPPADWTRVASLPRPAYLPATAETGSDVEMPTAIAEVDTLSE